MSRPKRFASCHPDRYHRANELCEVCYRRSKQNKQYHRKKGITRPYGIKFATCHPDRKHHAKGLCASCCAVQFVKNNPQVRDRVRLQQRARWNKNDKARNKYYKKEYNINVETYNKLLAEQNGICKICSKSNGNIRLAIDHNHSTGQVRGLLCSYCNGMVGHIETQHELLLKALAYLHYYNNIN